MDNITRFQMFLHGFVALGAMAGGSSALADPYTPMGIPADTLQHAPFTSFLIPGLLLFFVLGAGNAAALVISLNSSKMRPYAGGLAGGAMVIWIVVQCIMLQSVVFLHVLFFLIGIVQCLIALRQLIHEKAFPLNLFFKQ